MDPLDLAVCMKVLPRIVGGSGAIRRVLLGVMAWAQGRDRIDEGDADTVVEIWREQGRPPSMSGYDFPRCMAQLVNVGTPRRRRLYFLLVIGCFACFSVRKERAS